MRIHKEIFEKPAGGVRGVVCLFMPFRAKEFRLGHAYLIEGKPAEVTLKMPSGKLALSDVVSLTRALERFSEEVASA